jgi:hypothetical protein
MPSIEHSCCTFTGELLLRSIVPRCKNRKKCDRAYAAVQMRTYMLAIAFISLRGLLLLLLLLQQVFHCCC